MTVDALQRFLIDSFPDAPPTAVVEELADWGVRVRQPISAVNSRPGGTISGPSLMALADLTAWSAVLAEIGPVPLSVTTSLHIDFLRRPDLVDVLAEGRILKLGRRLAVIAVSMRSDGSGPVLAHAQVTYSIPPDRPPADGARPAGG